jgi:hypothetical protein
MSAQRVKKFIVKRRTIGVGAYNRYLHRRPTTYSRWHKVAEYLCACEAEQRLRKQQGLIDAAIFYDGQRLTEKGRHYYMKEMRDWLRANDLL